MKILYFYQYFTTPKGSYNTRVYEFTRRWVNAGDSVTVVTSVFDRSDLRPRKLLSRLQIEGVEVRVINVGLSNKHGIFRRLLTFFGYAFFACWYALTIPADVVVASSGPITVGLPGLLASYIRRKPFIFEVRDLWPQGAIEMGYLTNPLLVWLARAFEARCYRRASRVVALSEGMADWIRGKYGVTNITVVPNASDNAMFTEARKSPSVPAWASSKRLVVYAGNLGPGDDCGQILDLAKCLQADASFGDSTEIAIIGDGKQGPMLRRRAAQENLQVRFVGSMPRDELIRFLPAASCVIFVTRSLPFYDTCSPNKVFDALAAGVPVVQTTQGWIRRLFEQEQCGITVPQNNPQALAGAVLRLLNDEELRRRLAANGIRVALEQFDRDVLASRMRKAIGSVARSRPARRLVAGTSGAPGFGQR
jgi:glycosyltransferase involved in cell wall biosynthesis